MNELVRQIPLNRGQVTVVDASDYDYLMQWKWYAMFLGKTIYAVRRERIIEQPIEAKKKTIFMHRQILGAGPDNRLRVDHANGNGLDNRRANLRFASHAANLSNRGKNINNTSGFKGVSIDLSRPRLPYYSQITVQGKHIALGRYKSAEEAYLAYCYAAAHYHGEFARFA